MTKHKNYNIQILSRHGKFHHKEIVKAFGFLLPESQNLRSSLWTLRYNDREIESYAGKPSLQRGKTLAVEEFIFVATGVSLCFSWLLQ